MSYVKLVIFNGILNNYLIRTPSAYLIIGGAKNLSARVSNVSSHGEGPGAVADGVSACVGRSLAAVVLFNIIKN